VRVAQFKTVLQSIKYAAVRRLNGVEGRVDLSGLCTAVDLGLEWTVDWMGLYTDDAHGLEWTGILVDGSGRKWNVEWSEPRTLAANRT